MLTDNQYIKTDKIDEIIPKKYNFGCGLREERKCICIYLRKTLWILLCWAVIAPSCGCLSDVQMVCVRESQLVLVLLFEIVSSIVGL